MNARRLLNPEDTMPETPISIMRLRAVSFECDNCGHPTPLDPRAERWMLVIDNGNKSWRCPACAPPVEV